MPLAIDPHWEYWVPDREVQDILKEAGQYSHPYDGLELDERRLEKQDGNLGFRFGHGNPDTWNGFRFAPLRRPERLSTVPVNVTCQECGRMFNPDRNGRRYCGKTCRLTALHRRLRRGGPRQGRETFLLTCPCGAQVTTRRGQRQRYCSPSCPAIPNGRPSKIDPEALRQGILRGDKLQALAVRFGVQLTAIKRARKKLGMASLSSGRPRVLSDRECEGCGRLFRPAASHTRCCSHHCRALVQHRKRRHKANQGEGEPERV